ncbi:MAG: response regulator [Bacteroidota bacterium]|jgi:CheY-like chemotaxis protein
MNQRKILLVEDNPSDIALTKRALSKSRIVNELIVAEDGREALDFIFAKGNYEGRNVNDLPALVLLDLKLPKVDGLEVLRQIRSDPRTTKLLVVILTSSKEEQDLSAGYELHVNSYIQKPVNFSQFMDSVEQLGLYWLALNEPPPSYTS